MNILHNFTQIYKFVTCLQRWRCKEDVSISEEN